MADPAWTMRTFVVGPMRNNAFLLRCGRTGASMLVDAADEAPVLLDAVRGVHLAYVVTTHRHPDHWQALAAVAAATGAATVAHPLDAPHLPVPTTHPVAHGDTITVGLLRLTVVHLRGHTPGSIALHMASPGATESVQLWSGDSLFPGGVGTTFGDQAAFRQLLGDVEDRLFAALPDDTRVHPGHGASTTLGVERPHLAEWRARGW